MQCRWYKGQILFVAPHELGLSRTAFQVWVYDDGDGRGAWRIWKLIPMDVKGDFAPSGSSSETAGSGSLPSYDGDTTGQSSAHAQHTGSESDEFGTIVNEVTVVTTTITTRKRYRVEDT